MREQLDDKRMSKDEAASAELEQVLADINRFQNVVVHTVAYSKEGYWRHIRAIAEATGGQFEVFQ